MASKKATDRAAVIAELRQKAVADFQRGESTHPGMAVGLPDGWRHAYIPMDVHEDYRAQLRIKLEQAGYVPCDAFPETAGVTISALPGAEVWVTPEEAYQARFALKKRRNDEKLAMLRGEARRPERGVGLQTPLERMRAMAN